MNLPVVSDWIYFKDELIFASINYQATEKARKPMLDIYYCATECLNHNVLKTVQYDKSKFKKHETRL